MGITRLKLALLCVTALSTVSPAFAETVETRTASTAVQDDDPAPSPASVATADIIVTANKRAESINKVGLSITAVSGQKLLEAGVTSPADLVKVVPGFFYQRSLYGTPVYTLRAVGFNDTALGATPAVTVYLNEVTVPYTVMTLGTTLDIERVEVLKGPQGVLFGSNATGGAINYIAASPTRDFTAGGIVGANQFGLIEAEGYLSGPLSSTLRARVAVRTEQGGAWQRSLSRPGDRLGDARRLFGRALLDWTPSDRLSVRLSLNAWQDRSDTPGAQLYAINPAIPGVILPQLRAAFIPTGNDPRAADWDQNTAFRRNNKYQQAAIRADYELSDAAKLTSISAYSHYRGDTLTDIDGSSFQSLTIRQTGYVRSFFQELRLDTTLSDQASLLIGANYTKDRVHESVFVDTNVSAFLVFIGNPHALIDSRGDTKVRSHAAFAKFDYRVTPNLKLTAAGRYTLDRRDQTTCSYDGGDGGVASFQSRLTGRAIAPGACVTATNGVPGLVFTKLHENNFSWRLGSEWQVNRDALLYATVNKGYKAGAFGIFFALDASQLKPVPQESLIAYELGAKLTLVDRHLQLNGALFYYDYTQKQLHGRVLAPPTRSVEALVSVPKSRIRGGELQATYNSGTGFTFNLGASYSDSRIADGTSLYTPFGVLIDASGEAFPGAPKVQVNADVGYEHPISSTLLANVGLSVSHTSSTNSAFGELAAFNVPKYTLVDARIGLHPVGDRWRLNLYVRNLTDKYYYTSATQGIDTAVRYAGMGRTFGGTLSFNY